MSFRRTLYVRCDHCGQCLNAYGDMGEGELWDLAVKFGWTRDETTDACRGCTARIANGTPVMRVQV